ncbi:hypothetical protein F4553_001488 [Allocatelliglobosispora scoriae]|uniref:Uncharacterized protein n=1 Tax=Allocatelliglobosispora scoriae TaxID=643052 RepID=A0A841BLN8_9ACTN|nr:hypothetical protein [Allocatelliglobosispora scoriae]MBB5868109.1 hypothetical protein [Allocatelliglobosispora scoriae]
MRIATRLSVVVATVLGLLVLSGPAAHAAYYNTYSDIASTPDTSCCTGAQGFAAGATYLYSIKNHTNYDDVSVIYRVHKTTGARVLMANGTSGGSSNTWLGHANDMTIVDIDGQHHMFVVTMNDSGAQLVRLRYDDTTYYHAGSYQVRLAGAVAAPSGISRVSVTSTAITFMFKSGRTVYNGSLPLRASSGTINLTKAFVLQVDGALVNGATVPDLGTFANQGFFYDAAKKVLYNPLTKDNRSIVLVYRNVSPTTTGTAPAATDLSFRITSSKYSTKFEIEGVGISDGKLYFGTNRSNPDGAFDGVHVFDGYVA